MATTTTTSSKPSPIPPFTEHDKLGPLGKVNIEAGGDDHRVEAMFGFRRRYGNTVFPGHDVEPRLAETDRKARKTIAPKDGFVGRRHLLIEDIGVEAPAHFIVERLQAAKAPREGGPLDGAPDRAERGLSGGGSDSPNLH